MLRNCLAAAACALLGSSCATNRELPDPKELIPPKSRYNNTVLGFEFSYAPLLRIDANDRGYDGLHVQLLYPGNNKVVFDLNVGPASGDAAMRGDAIPGTEGATVVGGIPATQFDFFRDGDVDVKTRLLLKNEGWLYTFEGRGDTFSETLKTFKFTSGVTSGLSAAPPTP